MAISLWKQYGACVDATWEEHEMFFGEDEEQAAQTQHRYVREKYCYKCDVQVECLMYAVDNEIRFGVWGGLTESHRRRKLKTAIKRDGYSKETFIMVIEDLKPKKRR